MNAFARDIAFAVRTLRRSPGFALTVIATLALGIGASTAIFSVVDAVLLKPLPYAEPGRLVHIATDMRVRHVTDFPVPTGDLGDIIAEGTLLEDVGAVSTFRQSVSGDNREPEQIQTAFVTPNIVRLLGLHIALGRSFVPNDGTPNPRPPQRQPGQPGQQVQGPPPNRLPIYSLLSYGFWKRRYGGDSSIVGKTVDLGDFVVTVVGVLAPDAEILLPPELDVARHPDIWSAMRLDYQTGSRVNVQHRVIARLKPGVTLAQVQQQLEVIRQDLWKRFPIKESVGLYLRAVSLQDSLVSGVRQSLISLMGAVVFVLLIACANVANLQLVRASKRERELVVRSALGGQRWRLIRQMLAESLVLAVSGAAVGVLLASLAVSVLRVIGPANLPRLDAVTIDARVLAFTTLATLSAAAIFGIVPALRASRTDVADALRGTARTAGLHSSGMLRSGVVVAEVALSLVLLIGSGLMFRSFIALEGVNPGFDPAHLLTFQAQNLRVRGDTAAQAYVQQFEEKMKALPGVREVTAAQPLPLDGRISNGRWGNADALADPTRFHQGNVFFVLPGYFTVMRTKVIAGRQFTDADNRRDANVTVIDDLMARMAFGDARSAVGKRLLVRVRTDSAEWVDVIGVVQHERHDSLSSPGREAMFYTDGFVGHNAVDRWALRVDGDPLKLVPLIRAAAREIDPRIAVAEVKLMSEYVDQAAAPTRFALILIGVFGGIAAVLAAVGLYGVLSSLVRQRTAEIGVRMALGAPRASIFQLVIGHGLRLSALGMAAGLVGAFLLTRWMSTLLVGVTPTDPVTFAGIVVLFLVIASLSCWIPARRAVRLEPTLALRDE